MKSLHLKYNLLEKAFYLQHKSVWHQLLWYKCPILRPVMVMPWNARSVSNPGVCGSVGEKQKVQMRPWVLAHSHHVSHEIKPRNQLVRQSPICFHICSPLPLGVCASKYDEESCTERDRKGGIGRQIRKHILRLIDLRWSVLKKMQF